MDTIPSIFTMKIFCLCLLVFFANSYAEPRIQSDEQYLADSQIEDAHKANRVIEKDKKLSICIKEYIEKQSKSYSKATQHNLYELMNNFDNILLRLSGKKIGKDNIPYEKKILMLAEAQCNVYYDIGILK